MKLVDNWRAISFKSHSMIGYHLTGAFLLAPEALFLFMGIDTNPRLWWLLAVVAWAYGSIGRVLDQGLSK